MKNVKDLFKKEKTVTKDIQISKDGVSENEVIVKKMAFTAVENETLINAYKDYIAFNRKLNSIVSLYDCYDYKEIAEIIGKYFNDNDGFSCYDKKSYQMVVCKYKSILSFVNVFTDKKVHVSNIISIVDKDTNPCIPQGVLVDSLITDDEFEKLFK